ncbi:pantoate--beta-alanine ligase [Gracilibacillus xinjiangensis]|uniref:Pantothenate synthetase n=1 Tax=Gracilibacillus xinjiangensis TaxID=1193282 RepID=A0ABV8WY38_9BACI
MKIIRSIKEMKEISTNIKAKGDTIGFVPTMGYLHEGHAALIDVCRKETDIVIVSIFVNPLQFGPNEDFDRYPRDEERDRRIAERHRADYLFLPTVEEMYPEKASLSINVVDRTDVLCGRTRQGHFDGVVTVLAKLFHLTNSDVAYFGLKDAQQVAVVKALVDDLNFSVKIRPIPTVREADGLAKSSRNVYLSPEERMEASHLYKSLQIGQQLLIDGVKNTGIIINEVRKYLKNHTNGSIDYVEILSFPELKEISTINQPVILAVAVNFAKARLIDNILINGHGVIVSDPFQS